MPIIGRLDDQVDAVLIAPLDRAASEQEAAREQANDVSRMASQRDYQTRAESEGSQNNAGDKESLPVWLL